MKPLREIRYEKELAAAKELMKIANKYADQVRERRPVHFEEALKARTRWVIVTPAIIAVNVMVYLFMLFGADGSLGDPKTIVEWGGNFGPVTTNGGWWRLLAAVFLHTGLFHLLINTAGLAQAGLIVERLAGASALAATYIAAGMLAAVRGIWSDPLLVSAGPSAAIYGVYGLLTAACVMGLRQRTAVSIPLAALARVAPAAAIFMLYNSGGQGHFTGFMVGLLGGLVMTPGINLYKPAPARIGIVAGAAAALVIVLAVPVRGIADVRPEMARIAELEERATTKYDGAIDRFKKGRISPEALAKFIERELVPDFAAARARLEALRGVPAKHQPIVASAGEYVRLMQESWRLRLEGLRGASMKKLQQAESTEIAARLALEKVRI